MDNWVKKDDESNHDPQIGYESDQPRNEANPGQMEPSASAFITGVENEVNEEDAQYQARIQSAKEYSAQVVRKSATSAENAGDMVYEANPVANIHAAESGPQRYVPSPLQGSAECYQDSEIRSPTDLGVQQIQQETAENAHNSESYSSDHEDGGPAENGENKISMGALVQNIENEDMLAMTQHNQEMMIKNQKLDNVSERLTETERDPLK